MSITLSALFNDGASALGTSSWEAGVDDLGMPGVRPVASDAGATVVSLASSNFTEPTETGNGIFTAGLETIGMAGSDTGSDIFGNAITVSKQRGQQK